MAFPQLNGMFVIDPGYLLISERLVSKLRREQFVELADLVFENLKGQEAEPKFTLMVNFWSQLPRRKFLLCASFFPSGAHPFFPSDRSTQYKLLTLRTLCQFPSRAWLHNNSTFWKNAAASCVVDWSHMNRDITVGSLSTGVSRVSGHVAYVSSSVCFAICHCQTCPAHPPVKYFSGV